MSLAQTLWHYLRSKWERLLFGLVGAAFLAFTFILLVHGQVAGSSAVFAMAFFAFFYSNLARFKRFKGLGFEAELWEDKQNEAADLIDRLKNIVSIYTREIVMNSVMSGRWGGSGSDGWQKRWDLLNDLKGRHTDLGQEIDFTDLKNDVESVFLFDMCSPLAASVQRSIDSAKAALAKDAQRRFGNPVTDIEGWNRFHKELRSIGVMEEDLFQRAKTHNIAQEALDSAQTFKSTLKERFGIDLAYTPGVIERLTDITEAASHRPMTITPEMIEWADDHSAFRDR